MIYRGLSGILDYTGTTIDYFLGKNTKMPASFIYAIILILMSAVSIVLYFQIRM